ncbi:MAG: hypothetical protein ABJL99_15290 [Aliishimia sp.]
MLGSSLLCLPNLTRGQGRVLFEGEQHPVFNRIGTLGPSLYIDLGNPEWQAVAVTKQSWQVVTYLPSRFQRAASQRALPMPQPGAGDIDLLRPFAAAEPALGWEPGALIASYVANREQAGKLSVESNPVALAILNLLAEEMRWHGTVTALNSILACATATLT